MSACKYCKNVDTRDDYLALAEMIFDFGFLGQVSFEANLASNEKKEPVLTIGAIQLEGNSWEDKSVPIKYCPMCGRQLSTVVDNK